MGGCLLEVFMGTVILWGSSEDFGPLKDQSVLVPQVKEGLRRFLRGEGISISDIDTEGLHFY